MRRLAADDDKERGAVGVLVALLTVALLGFTALAVDVGLMYSERAQLQNGADAAALSIAQTCAADPDDPLCSDTSSLAKSYADRNANDGLTNVQDIDVNLEARHISVQTGAQEEGGGLNQISLVFANALGVASADVGAGAGAEWGTPLTGTAPFPLTFSICQVLDKEELQLFQSHGKGANPECGYGPSGHIVPGGFGWLRQESGQCGARINGEYADGRPGNSAASNCDTTLQAWAARIAAGQKVRVLLPVFDEVDGRGSNVRFSLLGFAAIEIHGWKFSGGNNSLPMSFHNTAHFVGNDLACTGSCRGVIGKFVEMVSLADGYELGPINNDLGAPVVRLTLGDNE